jgi:dGTPase
LAYLVEAADDICYTIIDFEDGISLVSEDFALEYLIKLVKDSIDLKYKTLETKEDRISYLRLSNRKFNQRCREGFVENEELILQENFLMP